MKPAYCLACGAAPGDDCATASTLETPEACLYYSPAVGHDIWLYNENRRVYPTGPGNNRPTGGPIYREHWERHKITGENRRSWLIHGEYGNHVRKVPKKPTEVQRRFICYNQRELDARCWVDKHHRHIVDMVRDCHDRQLLVKVADLLGYVG